ncbi:MAG: glycoside hydrolase family 18 protein [Pirellulales bacterium]|nr:glycoside hydrolase family 18 protein [Pirellulales bacterium]
MKIDRTDSLVLLVGLFVMLASTMAARGQLPADAGSETFGQVKPRIALGYLPGGSQIKLDEVPWDQLTHVAHAFLQADEQGTLLLTQDVPNTQVPSEAHDHNVRVLISLGGGQSVTVFEKISTDPSIRQTYVDHIVALIEKYDYDGVDMDWEFPRDMQSKRGFSALAQSLRTALDLLEKRSRDGRQYELSATISGNEFFGQWIDEKVLRESFDHLHVMTYDMAGPWSRVAAHHAPLYPSPNDPQRRWRSVDTSMLYWSRRRRIPKEKLCVGIPLYGRLFPVQQPYLPLDPATKDDHKLLAYNELRELSRAGWTTKWDPDMKVPWLFSPDGKALVAFDDGNSARAKATWAREQGLGGLFFWALGQDRMADGRSWLVHEAVTAWPK